MTKIKLTTDQKWKAGQTNILPIVGEVTFDTTGSFEIESQEDADLLKTIMPEFLSSEERDLNTQTESDDFSKSKEQGLNPQTEQNDFEKGRKPIEEIIKDLDKKSVAELKEVVETFPEDLTKDLKNKKDYISFLTEQLKIVDQKSKEQAAV